MSIIRFLVSFFFFWHQETYVDLSVLWGYDFDRLERCTVQNVGIRVQFS